MSNQFLGTVTYKEESTRGSRSVYVFTCASVDVSLSVLEVGLWCACNTTDEYMRFKEAELIPSGLTSAEMYKVPYVWFGALHKYTT